MSIKPLQALSVNLRRHTLDAASRNLGQLSGAIERVEAVNAERLQEEYNRLVQGLQRQVHRWRRHPDAIP